MPIMYFGNSKKYFDSPIRIITVGLNPSRRDFPDPDPFQRFQSMKQDHHYQFNQQYITALDQYFDKDPYKAWYDQSFEPLLNGLHASFYGNKENTVLHTDICSPLATNPTWDSLTKEAKKDLQTEGVQLWHELVEYLQPDVILISVAGEHLAKLQFKTVSDWETIYTLPNQRYLINSKKVQLAHKTASIYFGRAAEMPFGLVSPENKEKMGKHIKALTEKSDQPIDLKPFLHSAIKSEHHDAEYFRWNQEAN
ncbi:hypothetical protein [Bacillus sp. B1-b2]|uniref:hypothetical protein n=1 Tax=Bacillus sp. B1-b2 TaxID=2653201 RepID=UPI00186977B2|nr:hypothetical protein [Bacillus sp. B1-b2]